MTKTKRIVFIEPVYYYQMMEVTGKYQGFEFDKIRVNKVDDLFAYVEIHGNDYHITTVPREVKYKKGMAYVKFGKEKHVIGWYKERE